MSEPKPTKHDDDVRRGLRTDQYNGIIDTQLKTIDDLKAELKRLKKPAVIGGYNISEYIRMANSETLEFDNGDIFADMTLPERIKYIVKSHASLKAEVERLKAVSTIEQRTIQGLQQTPEWSEIARLTAYCRELEDKVKHLDLFKSVVEKFFNSTSLKNPLDTQSYYALAENLKQLPDSILDFTEEQVRDNPAWALAVFRHKVKEMQYKRIHDLNEIGGEQEENAHLHSQFANSEQENKTIKAENERLRKACELVFDESAKRKFLMCYRGNDFYVSLEAMEAMSVALGYRKAKEGKPSV